MPTTEGSEAEPPLFVALRRTGDRPGPGATAEGDATVRLAFDDEGAYLEVTDGQGRPRPFDYRSARGPLRDLLKALAAVEERQQDLVGWERSADRVYLHRHEHLIWLLRAGAPVLGPDRQPLRFEPGPVTIRLELTAEGSWIEGRLTLVRDGNVLARGEDFRLLNEAHVLVGDRILGTAPVGENYRRLALFAGRFPETMLERCLALFYSHFTGVELRYGDYTVAGGEPVHARAALLFRAVDESGELHFELVHSLPRFSADFVRRYDLTRVAHLNEVEKTVVVREVIHDSLVEARQELTRTLHRHEKELGARAGGFVYVDDQGFVIDRDLAARFLARELGELARRYALFGAETLRAYRIKPVTPRLKLKLGFGIDYLDGTAEVEIEGEVFSLMEVLAESRKHSCVTLADGTRAVINADYVAKLSRLFQRHEQGVRVSFFDLPAVEELIDANTDGAPFARAREVFLGFNSLADRGLPAPPIAAELRPYQLAGLKWLDYLHTHGLGGCLADDMGLGKTVQTIALLSRIYPAESTPSLLVMPRSLLFNWQREIERFCPALRWAVFHGANRDLDEAMKAHLVLTTYGTLRGSVEQFVGREFHYAILDEAQAIKNTDTRTSKAVLLLRARHRLALSGTPIENHLGELYSLFRFLNPSMFGSQADFDRRYAVPIQQQDDREAARELRRKIYPFVLRRLKRDVLRELPDKVEQTLFVDMSVEQKRLYESRRRFYRETLRQRIATDGLHASRFFVLEALLELRQLASIPEEKSEGAIVSPKRELLVESVQDAVLNGHKVLVFTNFLAAVDLLSADLAERGIGHLTLTGATGNRESLVRQFQSRDDIRVFLLTLKTGGLGLNLTAADTVFLFDPWWNTAAEAQAVDRAHRIGQDRTVFTYRLIVRESVEEKILELQARKKQLFDAVIGSDGTGLKSLTEADVDNLLG